ncbi:hypothetical protein [Desulfitobacterium metallireducens]|uniref:Septum formation initiator n=1 Tax=Desulfitobacterium metallireducens DSM 15288 TaxID=871968 RepID=W0EDZ4_9FIRM|nr:hypothetical protein [Desulfitobacterium metallireducens]AHF07723.1 septum formation initiator [Desulfitobacterium metallireducens DSM 15288]
MVVAQEKLEWQQPLDELPRPKKQPVRRKKAHSHWKSVLILGLTFSLAASLAVETINLTVVKGAQIRAMEKEITSLEADNNLLQVQVDKLRSVSRIESEAIAMGMEKPAGTVYVAGTLPVAKSQTGTVPTQTASQPATEQPSILKQISQKFTSFFASTQR